MAFPMTRTGGFLAALALAAPIPALAASPTVPMTANTASGREVIELDMAALTDRAPDRAPKRAATQFAAATTSVEAATHPVATANGSVARKRYPHPVGLYQDAPLIALLGWAN